MANDLHNSVLNASNRAREVKELFVADASYFTTFPGKNATLTIMPLGGSYREALYRQALRGNDFNG